jgi:hypothetical protein
VLKWRFLMSFVELGDFDFDFWEFDFIFATPKEV